MSAESDTTQTGKHFVGRIIYVFDTYEWQLFDIKVSFIGFILLYYFLDLFWVLHVYLMPKRFDGQMGFGSAGADAS